MRYTDYTREREKSQTSKPNDGHIRKSPKTSLPEIELPAHTKEPT
jgi:hypothetical protein